jgi:formamidopyrimidine-DNA glycosylase
MPELPEVETYVRELEPELQARSIVHAHVFWPRIIAEPSVPEFIEAIRGQRFAHFDRRGKYMLLGMESQLTLIVHLRMTGELHLHPPAVESDKHTHVVLDLDDGRSLHYRDQRKFGRLWLVDDPKRIVQRLGPEPLSSAFTSETLAQQVAGRSASIKSLLLDQAVVAGVGNIYADEALFRAGIHPLRPGGELTPDELARLHRGLQIVLRRGIELKGSSLQNYVRLGGLQGSYQEEHQVFRKEGAPCPRCGQPIQRIVVAQRSTHFCANCQPR